MSYYGISEKTITYVEENLGDSLSLEYISSYMNYSKYHFHRLFLSEANISIAKYVRHRRIVRSTYALLVSETNISNIAFDYGFGNVDTYIRCFKKYYGVTPSEYKELNKGLSKNDYEESVRMIRLTSDLSKCSLEDKENCISSLEEIIELSRIAHKEGLLHLESIVSENDSLFLKKAIELLLDGTDPQILRKILINYVVTSELSPRELLERVIYLEGVMLIQNGEYPWEIRKNLCSYFGENFISKLNSYFSINNKFLMNMEEYKNKTVNISKTFLLGNELKNIDKRSMQRLLRECDLIIIAIAFEGTSKELRGLLIDSLSESQQKIFSEIVELVDEPSITKIVDSQNELIKIIKELRRNRDMK